MAESQTAELRDRALGYLGDWRWRLNNLYWITDKDGRRVQFKTNWAQEQLFDDMHFMNVILKARQLGVTTFLQIFMLDACLFDSDTRAGVIAHNLNDARAIFQDKIKYPYDNLPDAIKDARPLISSTLLRRICARITFVSCWIMVRARWIRSSIVMWSFTAYASP